MEALQNLQVAHTATHDSFAEASKRTNQADNRPCDGEELLDSLVVCS